MVLLREITAFVLKKLVLEVPKALQHNGPILEGFISFGFNAF